MPNPESYKVLSGKFRAEVEKECDFMGEEVEVYIVSNPERKYVDEAL